MTRKLILICILAFFISPAISSAQTLAKVFDNPKDFDNFVGWSVMHIDVRAMKRVEMFDSESNKEYNEKLRKENFPDKGLKQLGTPAYDGFLMVVEVGSKLVNQSQKWGALELLEPPKINIIIGIQLGTRVRAQIQGVKRVLASFELLERTVHIDGEDKKYYIAEIRKIRPAPIR
jgi:hypothetical protein